MGCAVRQQGGHVAAAGADFQHFLVFLHSQILQQARFQARGQHHLAACATFAQGQLHVHKGQGFQAGRHKVFALDHRQQGQHVAVQNFPRADLLFNHVETGLIEIHRDSKR